MSENGKLAKNGADSGVIAAIPAYNAADDLESVVRQVKKHVRRCLVVDDGSTDRTADIARAAGAEVLAHDRNRGKGAAIRTALEYLQDQAFDYLVFLDADGQHDPDEIPLFVEKARAKSAGMVCGNRMGNPEGMPWVRRATNRTMSRLLSWLCHVRLSDTQCGFRLLSERLAKAIRLRKSNFEVESEILLETSRKGFTVAEVPVKTIYSDTRTSHIKPLRDTWRFLALIAGLIRSNRKSG